MSGLGDNLGLILALTLITFALGVLLGFVGAGGAGLTVALLTSVFGLPVHQAIGTGLVAMCFVSVAGAASHYRQGNIAVRAGVIVGLAGIVGAVAGANFGQGIPDGTLKLLAGSALWVLALLVWLRTRYADRILALAASGSGHPRRDLIIAVALGLFGGVASAFFGVGMAPLLQLGLLTALRLPLRQSVGTTMLTL
ncbi:MAG: sulfite exporter TauE/SafE family protein, partial [Chloroflexia bacterium]|nr:sulfite exporter TauE/SafE family protein [Chloroflexia bacterium]